MQFGNFGSIEMEMLWLGVALGLVHLVLVITANLVSGRVGWAIGARDQSGPAFGTIGARVDRAFGNYVETFAFFAAAVLLANTLGKHTQISAWGAELYIVSRVLYVLAYALGIPVLRTLIWTASYVGIVMVLLAVYPGL